MDWMPGVEQIRSQAHGGPIQPVGVMSHIMQGHQSTMLNWARERPMRTRISAQFTIGRDGRIVQHVGLRTQAWHAGRLDETPPTWSLLPPGGDPNDYTVGIEHEGFSGRPWTQPMLESSIRVQRWALDELGIVATSATVIGHYMTAPTSRAHDPGPTWPRARILAALAPIPQVPGEILDAMTSEQAEVHFLNGLYEVFEHASHYEEDGTKRRMVIEWLERTA